MIRKSFTQNTSGSVTFTDYNRPPFLAGSCIDAVQITEVVPEIQEIKPVGFLWPKPYNFSRTELRRTYGSYKEIRTPRLYAFPTEYYGTVGGTCGNDLNNFNDAYTATIPASLDSRARTDALNGLNQMKVNLGQAFAERTQTARLCTDAIKDVVSFARAVRKGNVKAVVKTLRGQIHPKLKRPLYKSEIKRILGQAKGSTKARKANVLYRKDKKIYDRNKFVKDGKKFTGRWLQLQYGVKPLMQDVFGALDTLEQRKVEELYYVVHGTAVEPVEVTKELSFMNAKTNVAVKGFHLVKYTIVGIPDFAPRGLMASVGLVNPTLIAWELVPFSFVVDWFLPVGDFIESFDAHLGWSKCTYAKSVYSQIEWKSTPFSKTVVSGSVTYNYVPNVSQGYKKSVSFVRTVAKDQPVPALPRFKDPVSLGHMANAMSLLVQIFGKGKSIVK